MKEYIKTVRLDAKNRISLGELIPEGTTSFRARIQENGEIVLTPMTEMPLRERWLWENKAAMESVRKGLTQAANGETIALAIAVSAMDEGE